MRVFVTGTGRCGTVTFSRACSHITNFTTGHESHAKMVKGRLDYPDNHIEVDPHHVYLMPLLLDKYPKALWVHLIRDRALTIASIQKRKSIAAYCKFAFQSEPDFKEAATLLYDTTISLIEKLLEDRCFMRIHLEKAPQQWDAFWDWIGAEGDMLAGKKEFKIHYNKSKL